MQQLPNNVDYEKSVITNLICWPGKHLLTASGMLMPDDFYDKTCADIFKIMIDLLATEMLPEQVDEIAVRTVLKQTKGNEAYVIISSFLDDIPVSINFTYHCQQIKKLSDKRRHWEQIVKIQHMVLDPDIDPIEIKQAVDSSFNFSSFDEANQKDFNIASICEEISEHAQDTTKHNRGILSPWSSLNKLNHGFQPQNLIILAARPGLGKSAMAINIADVVAASNKPVAFFSLEMSATEVMRRILSSRIGISASDILDGRIRAAEWLKFHEAQEFLKDKPLYINDKGNITVPEMAIKCRDIKAKHGLYLVIVDYIQLTKGPKEDRRDLEIGNISRNLKRLAKELDCPVLALSQLNRKLEEQKRRPVLSDLRESGSLEQDADAVYFLYRDAVAVSDQQLKPTELILAKQRNGEPGTVLLDFYGRTTTFMEQRK